MTQAIPPKQIGCETANLFRQGIHLKSLKKLLHFTEFSFIAASDN